MPETPPQQGEPDRLVDGNSAAQPPSVSPFSAAPPSGQPGLGAVLVDPAVIGAVIAQAAAIFAIAVGIVYAAGAVSLIFKLWYDGVPSLPVLVQLPRTWSISQAVTELLPIAVAIGALTVWAWNRVRRWKIARLLTEDAASQPGSGQRRLSAARWLAALIVAALCTAVALVVVRYAFISPIPSGKVDQTRGGLYPRPWWNILILCLVLDTVLIRLALHFAAHKPTGPRLLRRIPLGVFQAAVVALAFIPIVASTSEAFAFPLVKLCGQSFYNAGAAGRHYAFGNLIGVSGQYVYIAEVLTKQPTPNHYVFAAGYVAVIPLSEAQLMAIGRNASCGQLAAQTPHAASSPRADSSP